VKVFCLIFFYLILGKPIFSLMGENNKSYPVKKINKVLKIFLLCISHEMDCEDDYMKEYLKWIIGFGFLIWLIPFIVSFPIFDLRATNRPLFESIMPVVLTLVVILFSILFFKRVDQHHFKEGIIAGIIWFIMCIIIDLFLFLPESPMQMSLVSYLMDIGLTYVIIIIIPVGIGYMLDMKMKR
jgi:hypothetical protein